MGYMWQHREALSVSMPAATSGASKPPPYSLHEAGSMTDGCHWGVLGTRLATSPARPQSTAESLGNQRALPSPCTKAEVQNDSGCVQGVE